MRFLMWCHVATRTRAQGHARHCVQRCVRHSPQNAYIRCVAYKVVNAVIIKRGVLVHRRTPYLSSSVPRLCCVPPTAKVQDTKCGKLENELKSPKVKLASYSGGGAWCITAVKHILSLLSSCSCPTPCWRLALREPRCKIPCVATYHLPVNQFGITVNTTSYVWSHVSTLMICQCVSLYPCVLWHGRLCFCTVDVTAELNV